MTLILVFAVAFSAGCLTGVAVHLWLRHQQKSDSNGAGDAQVT
jgi:hypothetical protein